MNSFQFRKTAVLGGFLSRAEELGFSPIEAEVALMRLAANTKTAAQGAATIIAGMAPGALTTGAVLGAAPYFLGRGAGAAAGSAAHEYGRSLDRLDDPSMIGLTRRLIQVLHMNREIEGDLTAKSLPATRSVAERKKVPSRPKGPAEFAD